MSVLGKHHTFLGFSLIGYGHVRYLFEVRQIQICKGYVLEWSLYRDGFCDIIVDIESWFFFIYVYNVGMFVKSERFGDSV